MDMNLQKYVALVKTVELGSFTQAADVLNYSQSGISRMINDLEKEAGLILLERNRAGLRLTSEGLSIYPHIKKLTEDYELLENQINALNGLEDGLISIGTFSSVATHWLPTIIKNFQQDYPKIEFELLLGDYSEIEKWIIEGRVDFGFVRLPTVTQMETEFLANDDHMMILPSNHRLANSKYPYFPMKELATEVFILLEKDGDSDVLDQFAQMGVQPNIRFRTWDDYAVMAMVESGLGISLLPRLILQRIPYQVVIKPLEKPILRKIGLAYKNKNRLTLASKTFFNYIDVASLHP
ncbi:LysR family transcriptional regulator [Fundicoccus culcitae]|uniref:LysR family transcriptional regulator n=1 Tax=Fundicoccus culcitae TaxID=2969821 RepID=A0ABY5P875_9LACT|nr:LysR family transcriptional regulator [Fundicoccus culcitae]UUX34786.1 LysR family transcriptional regulator [Fundicoccus culcitae]